jgi:hypothetical protein
MKLLLAVVALLAVVFAVTSTEAVLPGFTITLSQHITPPKFWFFFFFFDF